MKKTWKKITSLFLSLLLMLSMVVTPVMAAEAKDAAKDAPSEVKECVHNGFWTDNINLRFEDTAWLNAVNSVTVNGTAYTKGTIPLAVIPMYGVSERQPELMILSKHFRSPVHQVSHIR